MRKTYIFTYSPADRDGYTETEFEADSDAEAMELFNEFCKNDLGGFTPEKLRVVAVDDCENIDGYEDNCL